MEQIKKFSITKLFTNAFIFSILIQVFSSCKEEPLKVGFQIIENDQLSFLDTVLDVELYTVANKVLFADNFGKSPLGSINDETFGKLKADYIADIRYGINSVNFYNISTSDTVQVLDLQLQLPYTSVYGNLDGFDFNVYELTQTIPDSLESGTALNQDMYDPTPINITQPVKLNDSTNIMTVTLSNEYARKFLNLDFVGDSIYYYLDTFKVVFKGFYIATKFRDSKGGAIITVDNYSSQLILRTLWTTNGVVDTLEDNFAVGYSKPVYDDYYGTIILNAGKHSNFYQSELSSEITSVYNDTLNHNPYAYIQGLSGSMVLAKIPQLKDLRSFFNYKVVVQKAELYLPYSNDNIYTTYKTPSFIGIRDALNDNFLTDDMAYYVTMSNGTKKLISSLDGFYDSTSFEYKLNIGTHIHRFMQDKSGTEFGDQFYVFAANIRLYSVYSSIYVTDFAYLYPGHVILNNKGAIKSPYLRVVYSKIIE
jgi:hypothetical protein